MAISRADLLDMLEPGLMHLFHGGCPTSKEQAKREGAKSYYDDGRCRNGHYAMKKLNGHCERCIKEKKNEMEVVINIGFNNLQDKKPCLGH